ncbi:glycosyltransferase [bacterium]|nr:glycosyltransferase [candidate division CSSED10-310 bacterium]
MNRLLRGLTLGILSADTGIRAAAARIRLAVQPITPYGPASPAIDTLSFVSYSITPWYGVWQRPQQFATRFARNHTGIYVDPMGLQHVIAGEAPAEMTRHDDRLTVFCPRVLPMGKTRSMIIDFNDALIIRQLDRMIRSMDLDRPVLITNTPLADRIAEHYPWRAVAFDVIDDFTQWAWSPADATIREQHLFHRADTVFTGTYSLYEKKKSFHPDTEFIPCGVEIDHFSRANDPDLPIPDDMIEIRKQGPIIGYFGGLNERIDANLLVHLAESIPTASVVLLGPVFADFGLSDFTDKWASLLPYPHSPGFRLKSKPNNLHIMGIRKYAELPAYLKAFDVCLLPYVISDATRDIHPVKGLEYLAAGRPVVSTPLPDVIRFYSGVVDVAETPERFSTIVRTHLDHPDPQKDHDRRMFAAPRSWDNMAKRMREKILMACGLSVTEVPDHVT